MSFFMAPLIGFFIFCTGINLITANCGVPQTSTSRVINGQYAQHGTWPWQVLLTINGKKSCGGSIVSPYHVVTAAHCLVNPRTGRAVPNYNVKVTVGDNDLIWPDVDERTYDVARVSVHPIFSHQTFMNDIAVLKVSTPIKFGKYVQPVCLPSGPVSVGTTCFITGWGRTSTSIIGMNQFLQQAKMPVVDTNVCAFHMQNVAPFWISGHNICSGYGDGKTSGCQGDSGGPFVCLNGNKWELQGSVSWGSLGCSQNPNEYTVYANIFNFKHWILTHMIF